MNIPSIVQELWNYWASFATSDGRGKKRYIAAIHAAVGRDYRPLAALFERIIERTRKRAASSR